VTFNSVRAASVVFRLGLQKSRLAAARWNSLNTPDTALSSACWTLNRSTALSGCEFAGTNSPWEQFGAVRSLKRKSKNALRSHHSDRPCSYGCSIMPPPRAMTLYPLQPVAPATRFIVSAKSCRSSIDINSASSGQATFHCFCLAYRTDS
jgi:hypothetical protein